MKVSDAINLFETFYEDFDRAKAENLLLDLQLEKDMRLSKMSKGMKEKVQLVLVMSRRAKIYILDEPLGGVDPASRDYILKTIMQNFDKNATLFISTHMIADIESILDEIVLIDNGEIVLHEKADTIRKKEKTSIDEFFRRKFYVR
jgi:ABC-2 type transport system ATP-binding protein